MRRSPRNVIAAQAVGWPASSGEPWLARFALGVAFLAALVGLIGMFGRWAIGGGWFEAIDAFTIDAAADHPLTRFFVIIAWLGPPVGLAAVSVPMLFALLRRRAFRGAAALFCSLVTAVYANDFLKDWVARERPEHAGIVEAGGYSFLSGHAFLGTAVYGLIAFLLIQNVDRPGRRFALGILSALFIALMGFGRVYLGVHYTSDVIGGLLLGIVWIVVWKGIFRPRGMKPARH